MRKRSHLGGRSGLTLLAGLSLLVAGTSVSSAMQEKTTTAAAPAAVVVKNNDFNGDKHPDVLSVDRSGRLWLYPGTGTRGWLPPTGYSLGWDKMTALLVPGDFDGDGDPDLLARDSQGYLRLYSSDGNSGWRRWKRFGSGWNSMKYIVGVGDFTGDGTMDILAVQYTGRLWLYQGDGKGGFRTGRTGYGFGWTRMTALLGIGDFDGNGFVDLAARDGNGLLWLYRGDGKGSWLGGRTQIGSGWSVFTALVTPWDFTGDGHSDVLARRGPTGDLMLYRGSGGDGWILPAPRIGGGWNSMNPIVS